MGQSAPAAAWGKDPGSLWNVDSRQLGTPPSLGAPNPVCVPSSTELTGPPLAGTHHQPSPSHPRQCTVGTQQRAMSVGVTRPPLSTPRTQGRLQGFASPRLAQVTRRQNSNPEKMLPSSRHSSGRAAPGCSGLGNKATRMHPLRGCTVLTCRQSPERTPVRPPEPASGIVTLQGMESLGILPEADYITGTRSPGWWGWGGDSMRSGWVQKVC